MPRRRVAAKREILPDPIFKSQLLAKFINMVMVDGKKSVAEKILYDALDRVTERAKGEPMDVLEKALENVRPMVEVKSRRVGGATYQVPLEVRPKRQIALAARWLIQFAEGRRGVPMRRALAMEMMDAYRGQGSAIKKRDDTHKMAQANKAFAHYRW